MIICTKEVSVGARKNAYNLLVEIGNAFVRFSGNTKGERGLFAARIILLSGLQCGSKVQKNNRLLCLLSRCHGAVFSLGLCRIYRLCHHDDMHGVGPDPSGV